MLITWLKRANELDPELPGIVIYLGRVLIEAGREAEAERILSELVIKHPANCRRPAYSATGEERRVRGA